MHSRPTAVTNSDVRVEHARLWPLINNCYRSAVRKLNQSYNDERPVAILVSEGRFGPSHVIGKFLQGIEEDVTVVRVDSTCTDPRAFMQEIVGSIGFESNDMSLADLEKVLELFLQYQRTHKLRTIITVQDSDAHGWWVLDKIRQLVELEAQERYGLKVIISGPPNDISVLNEPILDAIAAEASERIVLTPFTLAETRNYVARYTESRDPTSHAAEDVSRVFEFMAVTLIHEICGGVPDDVHRLCSQCFDIFHATGKALISTDTVKRAAALLGLTGLPVDNQQDLSACSREMDVVPVGRLVVETQGAEALEILLDQNCFLIGRDQMCNIRIHGLQVSRIHAAVSMTTHGVHVADLGSSNGTAVNGQNVQRFELQDDDVITIGDTRITYLAGSEQLTLESDIDSTDAFQALEPEPDPSITFLGKDMRLLRTS